MCTDPKGYLALASLGGLDCLALPVMISSNGLRSVRGCQEVNTLLPVCVFRFFLGRPGVICGSMTAKLPFSAIRFATLRAMAGS